MIRRLIILLLIAGCATYITEPEDCAGAAGGNAIVDDCDVCDGIDGYVAGSCYDCAGVANGTAIEDCLGVCGGDALSCEKPVIFNFKQSMQQALYFFTIVTINDENISPSDWVGAFNNDVCVGASQCKSGVCQLAIMGNDGNEFTQGYMTSGNVPSFKIYDASENTHYDAVASENIPWEEYGFIFIDSLNAITSP